MTAWRGAMSLLWVAGEDAGHGRPLGIVGRLKCLAAVHDDQRADQTRDLAKFEQVGLLLGAPAELALNLEKGLEEQDTAGADRLSDLGHPGPVEVVEQEHDVELPQLGPGPFEIGLDPLDGEAPSLGRVPPLADLGRVAIDGHDLGAELGRGKSMPAGPARDVENPRAPANQGRVRGKPIAGTLLESELGYRWSYRQTMNPSTRATIWDLSARRFDLLVVGGGATGAGIAREAALRGLAVALVERGDFGSGTSSKSSRLIHGGLRYLEHRRFGLVRESLAERGVLLRIAPHIVRPLGFLFPIYQSDRVSRWKTELGLTLYDLFALGGNVRRHRALGKRGVLDHEPLLKSRGLTGGALYWDAQCDDARLSLATLRSAANHGAVVANYTCVTAFEQENGRITGAIVEDQLTGAQGTVHARVVVNATGPWVDVIRKLEDPGATPSLAPTRGSHVMVPRSRIGHHHAITFMSPIDGRIMFVLPWGDRSYIGTTDTESADSIDRVTPTEADMRYLLRSANAIFPAARLGLEDVSFSWAGLRPLVADAAKTPGARSREHLITVGPRGLVSVAGGKLTTYRRMAIDAINRVREILQLPVVDSNPMKARSATDPLPGGDAYKVDALFARGVARGLSEPIVAHLVGQYGSEVPGLYDIADEWPNLKEPVHPHHGAIGAEVIHAVRTEYARRLDDVMFRRLSIAFETPDAGLAAADPVSRLMGRELGWDDPRRREEADRYRELARAIPRGRTL